MRHRLRGGGRAAHRRPGRHPRRPGEWDARHRPGGGGHPQLRGGHPHRPPRRRGQKAAHRPQPQRPGGAGHAPLPALGGRKDRGAPENPHPRPRRAGGAERGRGDARLHAPAARAARHLCPPAAGLRHDVRARHRPHGGRREAHESLPPRLRRAGRHHLPHRPRHDRRGAGLRRLLPQQPRRRLRPRLLRGARLRPGAGDGAPLPPLRGAGALLQLGVRLCLHRRRLYDGLLHHAAEEKPRHVRADTRQDRPRLRQPDNAADHAQGPAPGLQQGHAGGQGGRFRRL